MKGLNILLSVLMILFAYFQMNDPDPYGWVFIYLSTAVVCGFAFFDKYYLPFITTALSISLLWTASLLPDFYQWIVNGADSIVGSMKAKEPHIELTREFLGLIIISGILYFQYKQARKSLVK